MKVIDLLNKIANGEEVPNKINYMGTTYLKEQYDDTQRFMIDYLSEEDENALFDTYNISSIINDEVEIIEEDNKIEKLRIELDRYDDNRVNCYTANNLECDLAFKINEIIEVINGRD